MLALRSVRKCVHELARIYFRRARIQKLHTIPDLIDGEYGEGDGAEPQFGVADGSGVAKLEVVPGQGLIRNAVDGIGEAAVYQEEATEHLGAEAQIGRAHL